MAQPVPWQGWKFGPPKVKPKVRGKSKSAKLTTKASTKRTRVVIKLPDAPETPQQLTRDGIQFVKCSTCSFQVPTKRFKEHEEKCLRLWKKKNARSRRDAPFVPTVQNASRRVTPASPRLNSDALIQCTICRCQLREKNLARHQRRAHAADLVQAELPSIIHTRAVPIKTETAESELDHYDRRDASKYIGHFARDHGSFGSMPAYDDFSDEGSPD